MLQERKSPLIAEHETMAGVEHGGAALGREIERVLRQIVFSRDRLRRRASDVEGGNVVDGMRPSVGCEERQSVAETLAQAGFESVVTGVRDTRDLSDRTVNTVIGLRQRASGIKAALIYVVLGGFAGNINSWIAFDESRQSHAGCADISD